MRTKLFISSVKSNINLPKEKLEQIANHQAGSNGAFNNNFVLPGYESIAWQFLNTYGSGNVQMVFSNGNNNEIICLEIPTSADFLAFCTKGNTGNFQFEFGMSLS